MPVIDVYAAADLFPADADRRLAEELTACGRSLEHLRGASALRLLGRRHPPVDRPLTSWSVAGLPGCSRRARGRQASRHIARFLARCASEAGDRPRCRQGGSVRWRCCSLRHRWPRIAHPRCGLARAGSVPRPTTLITVTPSLGRSRCHNTTVVAARDDVRDAGGGRPRLCRDSDLGGSPADRAPALLIDGQRSIPTGWRHLSFRSL
jgi:hypothetical protein